MVIQTMWHEPDWSWNQQSVSCLAPLGTTINHSLVAFYDSLTDQPADELRCAFFRKNSPKLIPHNGIKQINVNERPVPKFRGEGDCFNLIHPGRLTWNLQITHLERKMIFQTSMIMFHVNLQGCIFTGSWNHRVNITHHPPRCQVFKAHLPRKSCGRKRCGLFGCPGTEVRIKG